MAKVLFLSANPIDTSRLRIDEEVREIDLALRRAEYREEVDIQQHWATRVADVQSLLLRHQPDIVHFSGHGSSASRIILEDGNGRGVEVPPQALGRLFGTITDNVRCVVLNACYSEDQARAISEHVGCVIGMSRAVGDTSAISFAAAFYQALGYGRDLRTAFDLACIQLELEASDDAETPAVIYRNPSAAELVLVPSRSFPLTVRSDDPSRRGQDQSCTMSSDVTIAQFTVDESNSAFRAYYYDSDRDIFPNESVISYPGGRVSAHGKDFQNREEFESFSSNLRKRTNHYLFSWVEDPADVPLVVAKRRESPEEVRKPGIGENPCFLITLQNDGPRQIVLNRAVVTVENALPVLGVGESARLDPLAYYDIEVPPSPGRYPVDLNPSMKIAADDAASLGLRMVGDRSGYILLCTITLAWNTGSVSTPRFILTY